MSTLASRLMGSVCLNSKSYEEVEADSNANGQAIGVVILASLGAALGVGNTDIGGIIAMLAAALLSWFVWVFLTLWIGTHVMPGRETRADLGQVLRATGFSAAPGVFRVFGLIPGIGWILFLAVNVWMLFSFVVAVRQALDYPSTNRALAVCLLGWLIHGFLFLGFVQVAV